MFKSDDQSSAGSCEPYRIVMKSNSQQQKGFFCSTRGTKENTNPSQDYFTMCTPLGEISGFGCATPIKPSRLPKLHASNRREDSYQKDVLYSTRAPHESF